MPSSGYDIVDGRIVIRNVPAATDRAACKALGVDWDDCVLWVGLPVMCEDGDALGMVGYVTFDRMTGTVDSVATDSGATANALLGKRTVPADLVKGFRRGMGVALAQMGEEGRAIRRGGARRHARADDAATVAVSEGGVAEKAGAATAVVVDKGHTTVDKAKPVASDAARKTGEVVNKGAYATGKQIAATKGMFSGFKEEYDKARGTNEEPDDQGGGASVSPHGGSRQAHAEEAGRQEAGAQEEHVLRLQRGVR